MTVKQLIDGLNSSIKSGKLKGTEWLFCGSVTNNNEMISIRPLEDICHDQITEVDGGDGMLIFYPTEQESIR